MYFQVRQWSGTLLKLPVGGLGGRTARGLSVESQGSDLQIWEVVPGNLEIALLIATTQSPARFVCKSQCTLCIAQLAVRNAYMTRDVD